MKNYRIPDTAKVRQKMLYASSKDALRRQLVGIAVEVQGTDASEVKCDFFLWDDFGFLALFHTKFSFFYLAG